MKAYLVLCTGIQMSLFECELVLPGQFFQVLDYSHLLVPPLAKIAQYIKKLIRLHIPWNTLYRLSIGLQEKSCRG